MSHPQYTSAGADPGFPGGVGALMFDAALFGDNVAKTKELVGLPPLDPPMLCNI